MISIIDKLYVVQLPECGVYQDIDPHTGKPFADEAAAQKWESDFIATVAAQQAAQQVLEQARLEALMHVEVTADKSRAMVGDTITLAGVMKNGLGQVVPLNDDFAVPVENERGEVMVIKLAAFVAGHASVSFAPARSGYYCVTEAGINHKLPPGVRIGLPVPLEIVVYE